MCLNIHETPTYLPFINIVHLQLPTPATYAYRYTYTATAFPTATPCTDNTRLRSYTLHPLPTPVCTVCTTTPHAYTICMRLTTATILHTSFLHLIHAAYLPLHSMHCNYASYTHVLQHTQQPISKGPECYAMHSLLPTFVIEGAAALLAIVRRVVRVM